MRAPIPIRPSFKVEFTFSKVEGVSQKKINPFKKEKTSECEWSRRANHPQSVCMLAFKLVVCDN